MLFDEFREGTGCKDNEYNYKIYKRLELMYMADDTITKAEIYEYGKKLVDNSKSEAELEAERKINQEIAEIKEQIEEYKKDVERNEYYAGIETDAGWKKSYKESARYYKKEIGKLRTQIKMLKWCLE